MARNLRPLIEAHERVLAREEGAICKDPGGRLKVALIYPNTYRVGMANLGLAVVYGLINQRSDALCERVFLPDPAQMALYRHARAPLLSLESSRPLSEFDLVLVTLSFENDAPHLFSMLAMGGLEPWAAQRRGPLVVGGGVVPMLNPEPLAPFFCGFLLGEAEVVLNPFLDRFLALGRPPREELLLALAQEVEGFYAPGFYEDSYLPDGRLAALTPRHDLPSRIKAPKYAGPAAGLAHSVVRAPGSEFGAMHLIEVGRGCGHGCRFCAAGHIFRPPRLGEAQDFLAVAREMAADGGRVGLVSAAVSDLPGADLLAQEIVAAGGQVSLSSLRADRLTPELASALAAGGLKTVALAPEAGSERLRRVINKHLSEDELARAVEILLEAGVPNLRLYFMLGLPEEQEEDLEELVGLARRVRSQVVSLSRPRGHLGTVTLSINAFVPKPWTPFQWTAMATPQVLKKRLARVKKELSRLANLKVTHDVPKHALVQAAIARGDRRLAPFIAAQAQGQPPPPAPEPGFYALRQREYEENLPWSVVDHGISSQYLWRQYQLGREARESPACAPRTCRLCGVCGDPAPAPPH